MTMPIYNITNLLDSDLPIFDFDDTINDRELAKNALRKNKRRIIGRRIDKLVKAYFVNRKYDQYEDVTKRLYDTFNLLSGLGIEIVNYIGAIFVDAISPCMETLNEMYSEKGTQKAIVSFNLWGLIEPSARQLGIDIAITNHAESYNGKVKKLVSRASEGIEWDGKTPIDTPERKIEAILAVKEHTGAKNPTYYTDMDRAEDKVKIVLEKNGFTIVDDIEALAKSLFMYQQANNVNSPSPILNI